MEEEENIKSVLKDYPKGYKFSRTEIIKLFKYWIREWKEEYINEYNKNPLKLTSRQWIAVWNAIQISNGTDTGKLSKDDKRVLETVKSKINDNKQLCWSGY